MTRHAKLTTIESACENLFYTQDLKNVDRKGIAIVLGHNASNHFCPTVIISQREYVSWQLSMLAMAVQHSPSYQKLIKKLSKSKGTFRKIGHYTCSSCKIIWGIHQAHFLCHRPCKRCYVLSSSTPVQVSLAALLSLILLLQALGKRGEKSIIVQSILIIL